VKKGGKTHCVKNKKGAKKGKRAGKGGTSR
jgi:hypothetical protein